jgi:hypothetical protein
MIALAISERAREGHGAFYLDLVGRSYPLPESGSLGDAGNYLRAWSFLGFGCITGAALLAGGCAARNREIRRPLVILALGSLLPDYICLKVIGLL